MPSPLDKYLKACLVTIFIGTFLAMMLLLWGCAHNVVTPNCADDSIVAAEIYHLRTGHKTYIVKSADGTHVQAFAMINGIETPLHVYPLFNWYVMPSKEDDMGGGRGTVYTKDEFIKAHRLRK